MPANFWTIASLLLAGAIAITLWVSLRMYQMTPTPPGQYPLSEIRPEYVPHEIEQPYRPVGGVIGSDDFVSRDGPDTKATCALLTSC
jgi:hypothetical protein